MTCVRARFVTHRLPEMNHAKIRYLWCQNWGKDNVSGEPLLRSCYAFAVSWQRSTNGRDQVSSGQGGLDARINK